MNLTNVTSNRLFGNLDEFLNQTLRNLGPVVSPQPHGLARYEDGESYRLRLDLPGFRREEVSLSLEKHTLAVTARNEREDAFYKHFEQTFRLPEDIDPEGVTAKLEDGVLDLTFRKLSAEEQGVRKIELS
jgi:HSP20 family molecular chaperone IbpA